MRRFRNVFRETLIESKRNLASVKSIEHQVRDLVAETVIGEFIGRIADDEKAAIGLNSSGPWLELAFRLKFFPIGRLFENVDVRFVGCQCVTFLELLRHHAKIKFCLYRDRRCHITVHEVVNEVLGLSVFPLIGMNGEGFFAERI